MPTICNRLPPRRASFREEVVALPGGAAALEAKVTELEAAAGVRLAAGATPCRRFMAHLREPRKVSYRCPTGLQGAGRATALKRAYILAAARIAVVLLLIVWCCFFVCPVK